MRLQAGTSIASPKDIGHRGDINCSFLLPGNPEDPRSGVPVEISLQNVAGNRSLRKGDTCGRAIAGREQIVETRDSNW